MLSQCPARNEVQRRRFSGSGAVAAVRRRRRQLADPGSKYLRAPDIETGRIAGRFRRLRPTEANCSGVLSGVRGLVFTAGRQDQRTAVAIASGANILSFAIDP